MNLSTNQSINDNLVQVEPIVNYSKLNQLLEYIYEEEFACRQTTKIFILEFMAACNVSSLQELANFCNNQHNEWFLSTQQKHTTRNGLLRVIDAYKYNSFGDMTLSLEEEKKKLVQMLATAAEQQKQLELEEVAKAQAVKDKQEKRLQQIMQSLNKIQTNHSIFWGNPLIKKDNNKVKITATAPQRYTVKKGNKILIKNKPIRTTAKFLMSRD